MVAIARFNTEDDWERIKYLIRRLLGGKALIMSEYAARMIEAIDELVEITAEHATPDNPLPDATLDRLVELDGRVEALRIRLGIESLSVQKKPEYWLKVWAYHNQWTYKGGITEIGYTKIWLANGHNSEDEFLAEVYLKWIPVDEDWKLRMKSLRAIAKELAVAPQLDGDEEDIMQLLARTGNRMTTSEILDAFNRTNNVKAESTIKLKLAGLTKRNI
jgi:hypothetical protein